MFIIVGGSFAFGASGYQIGTRARMGPGYFPLILGILLAVLGCAISFKSMITPKPDGDKVGKFACTGVSSFSVQ
jgi:hypothetical protein